ncbi:MAG TPA: DUF4810 domain-containing protein [Methylomirabilota bacterium]
MSRPGLAALLGLLALSAGCAPSTLYHWGKYEAVIYATYAAPGSVPPERQIELLEQDYQQARSANQPVPPGFHAYLGALYYAVGRADQARQEFETEKASFPESAVFMDRLLARLPAR